MDASCQPVEDPSSGKALPAMRRKGITLSGRRCPRLLFIAGLARPGSDGTGGRGSLQRKDTQQEFSVAADGKLLDATVQTTVSRMQAEFPWLRESVVEGHLMMSRAHAVYVAALSARYEQLGLSVARFNMLRWLYYSDKGAVSVTELGALLHVSAPNVMRMVQAMAAEGWLSLAKGTSDRRLTLVSLTEEGSSRFRSLLSQALQIWDELWSGLSEEEIQMLSHLLAKLRFNLLTRHIGQPNLLPHRLAQSGGRPRRAARTTQQPSET